MRKLSVIAIKKENWEYRCNDCHQLRFFPSKTKPRICGNCNAKNITVGRPGTLPRE